MPSELRHRVDRGQRYPLVRLTGVLDGETAAPLRAVLLAELATQPEAVVVDVGALRAPRPDAMAVLREVLDLTRDWPGSSLVLCASDDAPAWRSSGWPVWPDSAGAFAALGAPEPDLRVTVALEPTVGAARRSREVITEMCARWSRPDLAGNACIVATEMVNNVVAHARTPMRVLLALHGDMMSVAVRDGSAVLPRFAGPVPATSYGGRGLLLIDAISSRWGHLPLDDGKVTWALLVADQAAHRNSRIGMIGPSRG